MTHLEPYADEFVASHHSRLTPAPEFEELLKRAGEPTDSRVTPSGGWQSPIRFKALALAARLDEAEYLRQHTLLPLVSFFNDELRGSASNRGVGSLIGKATFRRTPRDRAFFCDQCVDEEKTRYGTSYWHVAHQIPGTYGCPLHPNQPLSTVALKAFDELPSAELTGIQHCSATLMEHAAVRRFNEACFAMFALRKPFSTVELRSALIRRGRSAGLRIGLGGGRLLLSDVASELLPGEFLQDAFHPGNRSPKVRGKPYFGIDAVLNRSVQCPVVSIALALALLYDSVEEGLASTFIAATQQV